MYIIHFRIYNNSGESFHNRLNAIPIVVSTFYYKPYTQISSIIAPAICVLTTTKQEGDE